MTSTCKFEIYVKRFEELRNWNETKPVPDALITLIKKTIDEIENEAPGSRLKTIERTVEETGIWFALELLKREILTDKGIFFKTTSSISRFFGVPTPSAYQTFRRVFFLKIYKAEIIDLTLNLAYSDCTYPTSEIENLLFKCPKRNPDDGLNEKHSELDKLENLIKSSKIIEKRNIVCDIKDLKLRSNDPHKVKNLFRLIMKKSRERLGGNDLLRWAAILQDFFSLQQKMFSILSKDDIGALFFEELLNFGTSEFLQMTSNFICPSLSFEEENKNEKGIVISREIVNLELLPFQNTAEVIFEVSERFIIGATDLEDEYLKIALDILHLIEVEEEGEVMAHHKQKISLLQIMNFFKLKDIKSAPHHIVTESKSSPLNLIEYALKKE